MINYAGEEVIKHQASNYHRIDFSEGNLKTNGRLRMPWYQEPQAAAAVSVDSILVTGQIGVSSV